MVKSCSAVGCTNRSGRCKRGISFYRFPADPEKWAQWVAAVRRENWEPKKSSWICSAHFVSGKKSEDALSPDYVPSVFSFVPSPVKRKQKILFESYERRSKRRCRSRLLPLSSEPATRTVPIPPAEGGLSATASNDRVPDVENGSDFIPPDDPASAVVDGAGEKSDVVNLQCHNTLLQEQVSKLQAENQFLRSNDVLSEESFINDDEKVKLYTGLPSCQASSYIGLCNCWLIGQATRQALTVQQVPACADETAPQPTGCRSGKAFRSVSKSSL